MMRGTATLALTFFSAAGLAQEPTEAGKEDPWSGSATLGYLATSGNTDNTSLNTGFEIGYETGNWLHTLRAKAINNSQDNETTAEAYEAGWKTDYTFSETSYVFGRLDWRKDRFSGYERQVSQSVGYGRRLIDAEAHTLNLEAGIGARQQVLRDLDQTEEDDVIFRAGLDYTWRLSETAEFRQDLIAESGESNTFIESITAIKASLIGEIALVASYTIRNNSDVPAGTQGTDRFTALSLEYTF
ncbi:MAG: DUF481 domain-containing protein [Pseudomonadota bacterium]